jgi:hypothetical protein
LLTNWSSKNQKYFDDAYQSRITITIQLITGIIETFTQTLPNEENVTLVDTLHNFPSILKSFQFSSMMIDELVTFEVKRLQERNYNPEQFLKKRKLDHDFQRRINDLFHNTTISINQKLEQQKDHGHSIDYSRVYDIYNNTVTDIMEQFPTNSFLGGISNFS